MKTIQNILNAVWQKIQNEPVIIKTALATAIAGGYLNFLAPTQITLLENLAALAVFVITAYSLRSDVAPVPPELRGSIIPGHKDNVPKEFVISDTPSGDQEN